MIFLFLPFKAKPFFLFSLSLSKRQPFFTFLPFAFKAKLFFTFLPFYLFTFKRYSAKMRAALSTFAAQGRVL